MTCAASSAFERGLTQVFRQFFDGSGLAGLGCGIGGLTPPSPANPPPPTQRARLGKPTTPRDAADEAQLQMPNERDESVSMMADAPDPVIEQAAVDVARGLQDTSKGAELNRAYKKLK